MDQKFNYKQWDYKYRRKYEQIFKNLGMESTFLSKTQNPENIKEADTFK